MKTLKNGSLTLLSSTCSNKNFVTFHLTVMGVTGESPVKKQREVHSELLLKGIILYFNDNKSQKGFIGKANCSSGTEKMPEKMVFSRLHLDIELLIRDSMLRVNTVRMMMCTEIIFFF
ncbi:MAG: hypothetical protein GY845_21955 [Planctomycetes bacterium]|nr:hypothetical protein [Planctomycetota bacterium]